MSFSRLFILSIFFCLLISLGSAFLMVRYVVREGAGIITPMVRTVVTSPVLTVSPELTSLEQAVQSVASIANISVVSIVVTKDIVTYKSDPFGFFYEPSGTVKRKVGGGTGFFVSKDGYILTNKHVVSGKDAAYSIILADGQELQARVLAYDPTTDLAIIRAFKDAQTPYMSAVPLSFV